MEGKDYFSTQKGKVMGRAQGTHRQQAPLKIPQRAQILILSRLIDQILQSSTPTGAGLIQETE